VSDKVLAIVGPTASGKSELGVRLAKAFDGQIISGDSIQVYRGFDIGSAKAAAAEMGGVRHHLIDTKDPTEPYNVCLFQTEGRQAITAIRRQGGLPLVVGGTGLYIKALLYDYTFTAMGATDHDSYQGLPTDQLYQRLAALDGPAAWKIGPANRQRLVHALAMAESGHLKSDQEAGQRHEMIYDAMVIGLTMPRALLVQRIDQRIDRMIAAGLEQEVRGLAGRYGWQIAGMKGIGYKEFQPYFEGRQTLAQTVTDIKTHTRQFAKRQYTWWRHQLPVRWYDITEPGYQDRIGQEVGTWLKD